MTGKFRATNTIESVTESAGQIFDAAIRRGLYDGYNPFKVINATIKRVMDYPIHQVCRWIGNSEAVAMNNYLQVREEDITLAVPKASLAATGQPQSPTQITTTQPAAPPEVFGDQKQRIGPPEMRRLRKTPWLPNLSPDCRRSSAGRITKKRFLMAWNQSKRYIEKMITINFPA